MIKTSDMAESNARKLVRLGATNIQTNLKICLKLQREERTECQVDMSVPKLVAVLLLEPARARNKSFLTSPTWSTSLLVSLTSRNRSFPSSLER